MAKITHVLKRSGTLVPFTPDRITNAIYRAAVAVGGRDRTTAENLSKQVVAELEAITDQQDPPTIEIIQDMVERVLIEAGHVKVAKAFILYRNERALKRQERAEIASRPSVNIPWAKIWHILDWAVDQNLNTTASLKKRINDGEFEEIISASEKMYEIDIENAVEMMKLRKENLRMVIITGPSSSGKTTTTTKIGKRLERMGLKLVTLNVDNYFFDLEMHPRDEFGDYDFETPQALDMALINEHLADLTAGKQVMIPFYDFKSGRRTDNKTAMQLHENEVILIDSLHGLYADMTMSIPDEQKFKLYLEPLLQMKTSSGDYIRWTDIRLMRRMLRDASHRAYDPRKTLAHWHYVRSSEMRNIIPYIGTTDFIINSAMPYELCIYRARLMDQFEQFVKDYKDDPLREDAFTRAERTLNFLKEIPSVVDDTPVPGDSVIREFIGGSTLDY
jgi:uridine kinase